MNVRYTTVYYITGRTEPKRLRKERLNADGVVDVNNHAKGTIGSASSWEVFCDVFRSLFLYVYPLALLFLLIATLMVSGCVKNKHYEGTTLQESCQVIEGVYYNDYIDCEWHCEREGKTPCEHILVDYGFTDMWECYCEV